MYKKIVITGFLFMSLLFAVGAAVLAENPPAPSTAEVAAALPGAAEAPASRATAEISVSTGTDLKIIGLECRMTTEECVLTWKTSVAPAAKAKIVFWSGNQPNILDPSFSIGETTGVLLHRYALKKAQLPPDFVKIRLSYIISEDAGAYSDVMAAEVKK